MHFTQWLQGLFPTCQFPQNLRRTRRIRCSVLPASFDSTSLSHLAERLEDRTLLTTFLVDGSFAGLADGTDPDGDGPATAIGVDAFASIQAALDAAQDGDTIIINAGRYYENIRIYKSLNISGATGHAADVVIGTNQGSAVSIYNSGSTLAGFSAVAMDGIGIYVQGGAGTNGVLTLDNVTATGSRDALLINANAGARYVVELNDVRLDGAGGDALEIIARNGASVTLSAAGLSATGAGQDGLRATSQSGAAINLNIVDSNFDGAGRSGMSFRGHGATLTGFVARSTMNHAGVFGTYAEFLDGAEGEFRFEYSLSDDAGVNGLRIVANDHAKLKYDVIDGSKLRSGQDAVHVIQNNWSLVDLFIDPTPQERGFKFRGENGAQLNAVVEATQLSSAAEPASFGVNGLLLGGADMNLIVRGALVNGVLVGSPSDGALLDGIFVKAVGTATDKSIFNATFTDSPITNSGRRGLALDLEHAEVNMTFAKGGFASSVGSVITGSANANVFVNALNSNVNLNFDAASGNLSGSGGDGIFTTVNNSTVNIAFAGQANLSNNARNGMLLGALNGSTVNVTANNGLNLNNAGTNGISINANASTVNVEGRNVSINNPGADGIFMLGQTGGIAGVRLTNLSGITNAGDNAIHMQLSGGAIGDIRLTPPTGQTLNLNGAINDGVLVNASGGATAILQLSNFSLSNSGGHGVNINLNGGRMLNSSLVNGTIQSNGSLSTTTAGVRVNATNGGSVGNRVGTTLGLNVTNVVIGNPLLTPTLQDYGFELIVDGNSYLGLRVLNSQINHNGGDGVRGIVNPDASLNDTSFLVMDFDGTNVINNRGDGFHLRANNGTGTLALQNSGIILDFAGGDITNNGNANPGDGIGDGIDARADGDGSVAANTIITLILSAFNLNGNDEDSLRTDQTNGGLVRLALTGGFIDSLVLCAVGPLDVRSISLNGTTVSTSLVMCAELGGIIEASISNINFVGFATAGVIFRAQTGGKINASLNNVLVQGNGNGIEPHTGLGGTGAIIGRVENAGSEVTFNMTNVTVTGNTAAGLSGFRLDVLDGGKYSSTIRTSTVQGNNPSAGRAEFDVNLDGAGTTATFDIIGLNVNNSTRRGLQFIGTNGASLDLPRFNQVFANDAVGFGLNIQLTNSNLVSMRTNIAHFNRSLTTGANIQITNATSPVDILLQNFQAEDAGANGINLELNNVSGASVVRGSAVRAQRAKTGHGMRVVANTMGATDSLEFTLDGNTLLGFSQLNGLQFQAGGALGSRAIVGIDGFNATGTKGTGVNIGFTGAVLADIIALNNMTMLGTKAFGISVQATGAATLRSLNSSAVNANGAAFGGMRVQLDQQAQPTTINVSNFTSNDSGRRGIEIGLDGNFGGGTSTVTLNNIEAQRTQTGNGLLFRTSAMGAADRVVLNLTNSNFSQNVGNELINTNAQGVTPRRRGTNAVAMQFAGALGSEVQVNLNGVQANHAGATGISAFFGTNVSGAIQQFDNISATNAFQTGFTFSTAPTARLTQLSSTNLNVSNARNGAGVYGFVNTQPVATNISFTDLTATGVGRTAVDLILDSIGGNSTVSLANVTGTGAQGGEGLNFVSRNMASGTNLDLNLTNANFSNSFLDATSLRFDGTVGSTATGTVRINGLTATGAGNDGIDLSLNNGVQVTVAEFNNVTAQSNEENGLKVLVTNGAGLVDFIAANLNLSNNATSGVGFDGIDVQVHGVASSAVFNLTNLTVNNSGGRGIDLDVFNNGSLTFNVNGGSVNNSGLEGLDLNVGSNDEFGLPVIFTPGATFNATFRDMTVNNNGQSLVFARDGVNLDVRGAGSVANVTFDHVSANNNDDDGFDIFTGLGATTTVALNNGSTGNNNGGPGGGVTGRGFKFIADGVGTTATLNSAAGAFGNNIFNNNLNGPGVEVILTNGVTSNGLTINASASGNAGDGVRIIANDGTGVTVANFGVSGAGLQVNNNAGNGLFVDFFAVAGVNSFDLSNATVSGNTGDQIFTRFRQMSLSDYFLRNVTVSGTGATSGDGIEIQLIDTFVTNISTPGVFRGFVIDNVHSFNNGGHGLNLSVEEADLPGFFGGGDGIISSGIAGGIIRSSQFNNNSLAGARLQFGGDGINDFEIFDNTTGFHTNGQEGLRFEIQDRSTFRLAGNNPFDPNPLTRSFFNNRVVNNGRVGVRFIANEPQDPDLTNADGFGPRFVLELGDILRNPNTITGNRDAAMSVEGAGDATGTFTIFNSILSNTLNGPLAGLNGEGLFVSMTDFSSLESLNIDGTAAGLSLNNNAGSGIVAQVSRSGRIGTVTRMRVVNTTITGNTLHGIDIQRSDNGLFGDVEANHAIILGQLNNGNIINNSGQNGINIVNTNKPGSPIAFNLSLNDNTINSSGRNGVFLRGTGNAQFSGNMSDNVISTSGRDGVEVILENAAALGNPNGAARPPFVMDGNQITNSTRHGIFFDTNFTNENGLFGGTAFANVDIRSSDNKVDAFGARVRTLISGNGQNGLQIIDNSQFGGGAGTPVVQNTYRVRGTDILNNGIDGIMALQGDLATARDFNNGFHLIIGDAATTFVGNRDVVIQGNRDDGIDLRIRDGQGTTIGTASPNRMTINRTLIRQNGAQGDNQRNELGPQNVGHGMEVEVTNNGNLVVEMTNLDVLQNAGDGMDFDIRTTRSGTVISTTFQGVQVSQNGGRGLDVNLEHDRIGSGSGTQFSTSNWNIGLNNQAFNNLVTNRFNENGREGIVFNVEATGMSAGTVRVPAPNDNFGDQQNRNHDVFVEGNLPRQLGPFPTTDFISTTHTGFGLLGVGNTIIGSGPHAATPADMLTFAGNLGTRVHLQANINVINTEVANNGGFAGFEDGLVMAIGYMTRVNSIIGNASFGGNVGDDIRVYPQQSNELLPPVSQRDGRDNPGQPGDTFIVYDPVAYLDLVFGMVDVNGDGTPDTVAGNGRSATSGTGGIGNGDQITVLPIGTVQTSQITNTGIITTADPMKRQTRPVYLAGRVYNDGVFQNTTVNNFFQNGVQQQMFSLFNPLTPFFFFERFTGVAVPQATTY